MEDVVKGMEVVLRSGATFTVDATELKTERNRATGELTSIAWTTPDGAKRKLFHIDPAEVVALVVLR
jgi:hypothetical protein